MPFPIWEPRIVRRYIRRLHHPIQLSKIDFSLGLKCSDECSLVRLIRQLENVHANVIYLSCIPRSERGDNVSCVRCHDSVIELDEKAAADKTIFLHRFALDLLGMRVLIPTE